MQGKMITKRIRSSFMKGLHRRTTLLATPLLSGTSFPFLYLV
jgi:hypothetical protein